MSLVVVSWSGGIDSTALIAKLLKHGHAVHAVTLGVYGGQFATRERRARELLLPTLNGMGDFAHCEAPADWIWAFSPDDVEIPRRNRYIIDHLIARYCTLFDTDQIGLGEYIGADTWVVRDHVGAADADARALAAYVYHEYGLDYRLWTLSDFGEARYKHQRLGMGFDAGINMTLTTNCLGDYPVHCGVCYKCIERSVAFDMLARADRTEYASDPRQHIMWKVYQQQMLGNHGAIAHDALFGQIRMPSKACQNG